MKMCGALPSLVRRNGPTPVRGWMKVVAVCGETCEGEAPPASAAVVARPRNFLRFMFVSQRTPFKRYPIEFLCKGLHCRTKQTCGIRRKQGRAISAGESTLFAHNFGVEGICYSVHKHASAEEIAIRPAAASLPDEPVTNRLSYGLGGMARPRGKSSAV